MDNKTKNKEAETSNYPFHIWKIKKSSISSGEKGKKKLQDYYNFSNENNKEWN